MRSTINVLKYNRLYPLLTHNKGYIGPQIVAVNKASYPLLLGRRKNTCYFDIILSLIIIKDGLKVFSNIISDKGKILLVGGNISFVSPLLCLSFPNYLNVVISPWNFSQIRDKNNLDFLLAHEVNKKVIIECENKTVPYMAVGAINSHGGTYPCNINLDNKVLSNWYLYAIINNCRRGLYLRAKKFNEI